MREGGRRIPAGVVLVLALVGGSLPARAQNAVRNPGMEEGAPGGLPVGWSLGLPRPGARSDTAYAVELVDSGAHLGRRALRIARAYPADTTSAGVMQSIDATPYRGKTVWLRAFVRITIPVQDRPIAALRTGLWLRVEWAGGATGFFDDMQQQPIYQEDWRPYEIVGTVAPDAERISFGLQLVGPAQVWLDDVSLRVVPDLPAPEPARPLSAQGLANEIAFARLLGYVRFFHPSDEATATDWNAFAIRGARVVERAVDARQLATLLDSLFRPLAPSLVVAVGRMDRAAARTLAAPFPPAVQVVMWRHRGLGAGLPYPQYGSERIRAPAPGGAVPDTFAAPGRPLRVELGDGVRALIPIAVYADSLGTLPRGVAPTHLDELPASRYTADDRAARLADIALAWSIYQHFYPYFDVVGTDWEAQLAPALRQAALDPDARAFHRTLRWLTARLHDGHALTSFGGDPRNTQAPVQLAYVEGKIVVLAAAAGEHRLRRGDVVLNIDGRSAGRLLREEESLTSAATPGFLHYRALGRLLDGPRGSEVALDVRHADGVRERVPLRRTGEWAPVSRPGPIEELRPGVWYIDTGAATAQDYAAATPVLLKARGLVIDLRANPPGKPGANPFWIFAHLSRMPVATDSIHWPIVTRPDRTAWRFERTRAYFPEPAEPFFAARKAFLTNASDVSSAETFLAPVESSHLGEIVGEPTAGTNGDQNRAFLPGGFTIFWTGCRTLKPDGSRRHGVGIVPTVPVSRTIAGIAAGRDEQLEKALDVVDRR